MTQGRDYEEPAVQRLIYSPGKYPKGERPQNKIGQTIMSFRIKIGINNLNASYLTQIFHNFRVFKYI